MTVLQGAKPNKFVDVSLELLHNISIKIYQPSNNHDLYWGSCHKCQLYCWKCTHSFWPITSLDNVLIVAPYKILDHYNLRPMGDDALPWIEPGDMIGARKIFEVADPLLSCPHSTKLG